MTLTCVLNKEPGRGRERKRERREGSLGQDQSGSAKAWRGDMIGHGVFRVVRGARLPSRESPEGARSRGWKGRQGLDSREPEDLILNKSGQVVRQAGA